ncbi:MAG: fibronectin type III domain-containing protein [Bacteroidales bacterium]|nr:fibronectin type III domain-containing protein [Bacteroidales bacterium]
MKRLFSFFTLNIVLLFEAISQTVTVQIGTGTLTNSTTTYPAPYGTWYKNSRHQILLLASELQGAGLTAGNITAIAFNVASVNNCSAMPNYTIKMKHTSATSVTSTFDNSGFTTVYTSPSFMPTTGWNTHTFNTPFTWNGTSNILIDICFSMVSNYTQNASTYYTSTPTSMTVYYASDTYTACGTTSSGIPLNSRPNIRITGQAASCTPPSNINITQLTSSSITFNWSSNAPQFQIEYGPQGFTQGNGTLINNVTDSTYTITGLNPTTTYDIYIRSICNAGDTSSWALITITTQCLEISTFPWLENFNGGTFPPSCWSRARGQLTQNVTFTSNTSYWTTKYFANQGNDISARVNNYGTGRYEWLITPPINLGDGSTNYKLEFDLALTEYNDPLPPQPAADDKFAVVISTDNGLTWSSLNTLRQWDNQGSQFVYNNISYTGEHVIIPLTGYTGIVKIGFYAESTQSNGDNDLFVDNVKISLLTNCPEPIGLSASNITGTSALLSWLPTGNETSWNIEYGPQGFTQGTGTIINNVTNPYLLQGLQPNTYYTFYVQANCGNETSPWSSPKNFMTAQIPATLPFCTDFESGANDWTIVNGNQTNKWYIGNATAYNSQKSIYISNTNGATNEYSTTSSSVVHFYRDVTFPSTTYPLYLDFNWKAYGESSYDYLRVYIFNTTEVPIAGTLPSSGSIGSNFNLQSNWQSASLLLPDSLKGKTKRIVFTWRNDGSIGTQPPAAVDNICFYALTCPKPTNLNAQNITSTTATISWQPGGTETTWQIAYGVSGFSLNNATYIITNNNNYNLTGLTPATNYAFYVRAICGQGDTSIWSGPFSFWTECASLNATYSQNFDAVSVPSLPKCWNKKVVASSGSPEVKTVNSTYYSSPNCVQLFNSTASGPSTYIMLISPEFADLTSHSTQITFKAKFSGSGTPVLYIGTMTDTTNPATYTNYQTISNLTNEWLDFTVSFANYNGTGRFIVFKHGTYGNNQYIYLDNFIYEPIPSCPKPTQFTLTNITPTSVTLTWIPGGNETSWNIEYGPTGFTPGTGTIINNINTNTYTLTGLVPTLTYDVYVSAQCNPNNSSTWTGPITFTTPQQPATLPFTWNFEQGFEGWTVVNGNQTNKWCVGTATFFSPDSAAYISNNNGISNQYNVSSASVVHLYKDIQFNDALEFAIIFNWKGQGESTYDYMRVFLQDQSFIPQEGVLPSTGQIGKQYYNLSNTWKTDTIFLTSNVTNTIKRLIFTWRNDGSIGTQPPIAIDDINIIPIYCARPQDLGVASVTPTSAEVYWNPVGPESQWQVQYGLQGFQLGSGTTFTTNEYPVLITGLQGGYNYSFYVRAICGPGDTSFWAGPFTFSVPCSPFTATYSENFDNVTAPNLPLCWTKIVVATSTYATVQTSTSSPYSSPNCIYLYNSSSSGSNTNILLITPPFSDIQTNTTRIRFKYKGTAGEKLIIGTMSNNQDYSTFVPFDTITMTSSTTWNSYLYNFINNNYNQYIAFKHGATITYSSIYIDDFIYENLPPIDLKILSITKPSTYCGLTSNERIGILIQNVGTSIVTNFNAYYKINNQQVIVETVNYTLSPGSTYEYEFLTQADLSQYTTYNIKAYIYTNNDVDQTNDTIIKIINNSPLINTFPYVDNFETNIGWVSGGINSTWQWGTPAGTYINSAASGTKCWVTNLTGYYNNNENSYVKGPCFDFSALTNPHVTLKYNVHAENSWDGAALQYSIDGGNTWQHVGAYLDPNNWYNDNTISGLQFSGSQHGWTGNSNGWKTALHSLSNLAGNSSVQFRIVFGSDGIINSYEGFAFDDFIIFEPYDLSIVYPQDSSTSYACGLTNQEQLFIWVKNIGGSPIPAGEKIYAWYKLNNNSPIKDSLVLSNTLNANDSVKIIFSQTANLSALTTYTILYWIKFAGDFEPSNDTIITTIQHIQLTVNIQGGDTVYTSSIFLPYTLTLEYSPYPYQSYFWSNSTGTLTGTLPYFNAPQYGWYYVTVTYDDCSASDSIFVTYPLSVSFSNNNFISVVPSKFNDFIYITSTDKIDNDIYMYLSSIEGKVLIKHHYHKGYIINHKINTESLKPGIYILTLNSINNTYKFKLVK